MASKSGRLTICVLISLILSPSVVLYNPLVSLRKIVSLPQIEREMC